jgi:hypothetical protein
MKRIALLTVLLLVVGLSLGFSQEFKPSVAWTTAGTASVTWGIDLDNMTTGFVNAGSAQFAVTFVPAVTLTKGADAPIYGSITLTTTALSLFDTSANNASAATAVSAKIVAKPVEFGVYAAPSIALGKVTVIENSGNNADIVGVLNTGDLALANTITGSGTYVKYVSDMVTVQASVISRLAGYTNVIADYAGGVDATLVFKPITLGFGAWDGLTTGDVPLVYATVATDAIGPLTLGAQLDLALATTPAYDVGASVLLALTKATSFNTYVNYGANFSGLDVKAVFTTTEVANLTETLTAYVLDLASTSVMRLVVDNTLSYAVKIADGQTVTPSLQVQYGMDAAAANHLKAVAAVSAAVIPNTTIALTYTSGDLLLTTPVLGTVTCALTVAY